MTRRGARRGGPRHEGVAGPEQRLDGRELLTSSARRLGACSAEHADSDFAWSPNDGDNLPQANRRADINVPCLDLSLSFGEIYCGVLDT